MRKSQRADYVPLASICVAQLGARMHYAVPRILHKADMLETLFTDATGTSFWARCLQALPSAAQPRALKRLLGRVPLGIPRERITAFERFGWEYAWRLWRTQGRGQAAQAEIHLWSAREFCRLVLSDGLEEAAGIYGFNSACLELMEFASCNGLSGFVEQTIAPVEIEERLVAMEMETNPGWEISVASSPAVRELAAREKGEWEQASLILCASEFVRQSIAKCGGPVERCAVVPYGVDVVMAPPQRKSKPSTLHVLAAGSLCQRKGAPYALAAAQLLRGVAELRWAGPVNVLPAAVSRLARHIDVRGPVPRSAMSAEYAWADVFLLPTLCEGSATVCYEALAAGLPVITTPNAGSVVRDGIDGFIVPIRDAEGIVAKLELLARDRNLRAWMSDNARQRAQQFTLQKYGERLVATLRDTIRYFDCCAKDRVEPAIRD